MKYVARILSVSSVTHDVKRFVLEKPEGYAFVPGQATDVAINKTGLEEEERPFTFTSLNSDPHVEFTIKIYSDHDGVTRKLGQLQPGDELILHDAWGAIQYKGPGWFIAGGAGITPFIAILRQLRKDDKLAGNSLLFSNKTAKDIILKEELRQMLGENCVLTVTREKTREFDGRRIDEAFLREKVTDFTRHFYVCGPDKMVEEVSRILKKLGATPDTVIFEK